VSPGGEDKPQALGDADVVGEILRAILLGRPAGSESDNLPSESFAGQQSTGGTMKSLPPRPVLCLRIGDGSPVAADEIEKVEGIHDLILFHGISRS
jgi:hypothetical protein